MLIIILIILLTDIPQSPKQVDSLRRVQMASLFLADDRDGFFTANRELIEYHKARNNEKLLFNAYATMMDRMMIWGRFDEAIQILDEMSNEAQLRKSEIGFAVTEFCFGHFYLDNRQPQESKVHYERAFRMLKDLKEDGRAIRAGFNLQAIAMNLGMPEEGLAINDSTALLLAAMEEKAGRQLYDQRMKQTRYRFVLYQRIGELDKARPLKDSLEHYAAIVNDPGYNEIVQSAIFQFEQLTGQKEKAYARLDTLIAHYLRDGNFLKAARFRLTLANYQRDNGDLALAVDNYHAYAVENDSAQVHLTNDKLNLLTKKYELNELRMKNVASKKRIAALTAVTILISLIAAITFGYARTLRRKNRTLYEASLKTIQLEKKEEQTFISSKDDEQQSPEEILYTGFLSILLKDHLFKEQEINRDDISLRLGTNRTYLAEAVKKCSGYTLSGLVNHLRLRWAAEALSSSPEMSVTRIGEDAGFNSRSTFNRQFQKEYGMTPSEYREASQVA